MEIRKSIKMQDSGLKFEKRASGESSVNLTKEIAKLLLNVDDVHNDSNSDVEFEIYKEDFIKALCYIMSHLPLYRTSSDIKDAKELTFSMDLYNDYFSKITDFFGTSEKKVYRCNLLIKKDGRVYLNNLRTGTFSMREFLIEDNSTLIFSRNNVGKTIVRLETGQMEKEQIVNVTTETIIEEKQHCNFVFKCMSYFKDKKIWGNINKYVSPFEKGDSIKVSDEPNFRLTGMFKYVDEDRLAELNNPRRRWYLEPFTVLGKTVYLSTEWYPGGDQGRNYPLEISSFKIFVSDCFGKEYRIVKNENGNWELQYVTKPYETKDHDGELDNKITDPHDSIPQQDFSIKEIIALIAETGLLYDPLLIKRFAFSLMSKQFLILSGLAGSGKTQLALAFASALIQSDEQMCVVPVGSDWTNREPLLGFPNALVDGRYEKPESGVLDLLINANKPENADKPYFLILDEMNMSYVERYFADFLSAMESHKAIPLWKGGEECEDAPNSITLPSNLFIIGTINVDETTYMFSPKVLDRANVIEFKISEDEMAMFLKEMKPVNRDSINYKAACMGASFVALAKNKDLADDEGVIQTTLNAFFGNLKSVNAEFGYRSATEIYRFISQSQSNDDTDNKMTMEDILDSAIVQKLLPKLHGSRKKLEPILLALWKECFGLDKKETTSISRANVAKAKYPLTADKIQRMYDAAYANGFTSFAEA